MSSFEKAFDILEAFLKAQKSELRGTEIARLSGLPVSTVSRMAGLLVKRGYLKQAGKRGKFSPGIKLFHFRNLIDQNLVIKEVARPYLEELSTTTGETVMLAVFENNKVHYIDEISSKYLLRIMVNPERDTPLYCTGFGKLFLAAMTPQEQENYFRSTKLVKYTRNTITEIDQLKEQFKIILDNNIAFDDEEYGEGIKNIVSGVKDADSRVVAGIGIIAPSSRLPMQKMKDLTPIIKKYAEAISMELR